MAKVIFFIIVVILTAYLVYVLREKRSINKHKKNQNYTRKSDKDEREQDNLNM